MSTEPASITAEFPASTGFVGRRQELGALRSALTEALSGQGRLVMLAGEPGIGKTRTAQELASYAQESGTQVLWGRCYEEQGTPPYWPWVQALRPYVRELDAEQLRSQMGEGASDIAEFLPYVKSKLPGLPPSPPLDSPEYARFRLFDSITTFLRSVAQAQPLVIVLDDLHWADQPSLLLLQFVATEMSDSRLLIIGCYRDVELSRLHPLSETLAQLSRESLFRRVVLRGLSQEDTSRFVEVTAGVTPEPSLVRTIHAHAEGNPFFMTEVIHLLQEQEDLSRDQVGGSQSIRIPEGVREVIGRRLNRLSPECNEALRVASVIGREFALPQLGRVMESISEDRLIEVLEEALAARVVEEVLQAPGNFQFSHALIQETLIQELSLTRRVRLHARVAESLEAMYGSDTLEHAAELAHHFAEAETVLGREKVVQYCLAAGERALAAYAYEDALAHFQRGLDAKGDKTVDAETASLLFGLGRAQIATLERPELQRAVETLTRAFEHYLQIGDTEQAVAVASCRITHVQGITRMSDLIGRAIELVPPDSLQAGRLLTSYGDHLAADTGDLRGAEEALTRALAIAQREQDVALEIWALSYTADHDREYEQNLVGRLDKDRRVIEMARGLDEPFAELRARLDLADALMSLGDPDQAKVHAEAGLALAEKLHIRREHEAMLFDNHRLAHSGGDWVTARALSDRGLTIAPGSAILLAWRVLLEYQVGEFIQGETFLERLLQVMKRTPPGPSYGYIMPAVVLPVIARITGDLSKFDIAKTSAQASLSAKVAIPNRVSGARVSLALMAVQGGDPATAREQYNVLVSKRGIKLQISEIQTDHVLGLLAHTMGLLDKAVEHFEDALAFCRKASYRPELAWSCHDYAEALLRRNAPGDHARATSLLAESLAISSELGMRPLMERVVALQERADAQPARAPAYPADLTHREIEVLRLVAAGKSNAEIAQELFISANTVAHHVTNILNKTSSANRTEAAIYAAQHGLI